MVDVDELVSRGVDGLEVPGGHAIHPLLQPLFPGGLMPAVYRLDGASSVGLGLLTHGWCGVVGLPELSVEAARQWGCPYVPRQAARGRGDGSRVGVGAR